MSICENKNNQVNDENFIEDNINLVHHVLQKHLRLKPYSEEYEEVFQEGCVGLVKAQKQFKPELGFQFTTYAVSKIIGEVRRSRRDTSKTIKFSRSIRDNSYKMSRLEKLGYTKEEIKEELGFTNKDLFDIDNFRKIPMYINEVVFDNNDGSEPITFEEKIGNEDDTSKIMLINDLEDELEEREIEIVKLIDKGLVQQEIADIIGLSQVQVSRIIGIIREKVKNYINGQPNKTKKVCVVESKEIGGHEMSRTNREDILKVIRESKGITVREISEKTGLIDYNVRYHVRSLVAEGEIKKLPKKMYMCSQKQKLNQEKQEVKVQEKSKQEKVEVNKPKYKEPSIADNLELVRAEIIKQKESKKGREGILEFSEENIEVKSEENEAIFSKFFRWD